MSNKNVVFEVTQDNAEEVAAALGLPAPLIMENAPPMRFERLPAVDIQPKLPTLVKIARNTDDADDDVPELVNFGKE